MSIQGDRNFGGMFSPGEILTASKMNELSAAAGYGKQWHSSGAQVVQGTFGTVDLSGKDIINPSDDNQFAISFNKEGDNVWFKINPGYVTVTDMRLPFLGFNFQSGAGETKYVDGKGVFNAGECSNGLTAELQDCGVSTVYYVDSCNAFGAKKNSGKSNKLIENSFRPNTGSSPITLIFLYRSTPGFGIPKLGVMNLSTFQQHFANAGTTDDGTKFYTSPYTTSATFGAPALLRAIIPYEKMGVIVQVEPEIVGRGIAVLPNWPNSNQYNQIAGLGLLVQVLAFYDSRDKGRFIEVNRGHSWMTNASVFAGTELRDITVYETGPTPFVRNVQNYGWHSYYYTMGEAGAITGLTFENSTFAKKEPPYFFT